MGIIKTESSNLVNMEAKFKLGDLVKLKSGGPVMTVVEIIEGYLTEVDARYYCVWFSGKKQEGGKFVEPSLLPATEEDLK